ncbi:protein-L-isoaspartate O-methyltransferase family protein [Bradyrhizobium septentrionale]|uniref:Protein-L-isoaspartate O-methyltransferase n=1 Tax=Bradyrhizobium septentrionale TaxID=1404411 RepID=A0A973W8P5_9BRAD|nr:methyltransferase domain-containing protein [Bradyrhizobium septentrionale]UGY18255.1 methyltransferase domain-containing protein [Bradyrhizobium septentrionale]UGY26953.1 methyltransferase domain-containing protein [Bradyrhizobium septentrionale]
MDPQAELRIIRAAYAKQIMAAANVRDTRVAAAFAAIPREDFVGPGPWMMLRWWTRDYVPTPDADPVYLYTNDLVALLPDRRLNNGQPSLHAHLMHQAAPADGEHVVHVGTGTGYYTALLAHLVGPTGRVTGIEYDPELAARARANLTAYMNVEIIAGDGTLVAFEPADVIYVNAGCTRPAARWLDGLADGGRLILPLTSDGGFKGGTPEQVARSGAVFRIRREEAGYRASWISAVAIIPCDGGRDEPSEKALAEAFAGGGWQKVARLYRDADIPDERCWLRGDGWCLAYD